jgi:hypothetical protein
VKSNKKDLTFDFTFKPKQIDFFVNPQINKNMLGHFYNAAHSFSPSPLLHISIVEQSHEGKAPPWKLRTLDQLFPHAHQSL